VSFNLRVAGAPAAQARDVPEALRGRGVRIDGEGRLGAGAAWTVVPVELKLFKR
jgi:hypothetical protein